MQTRLWALLRVLALIGALALSGCATEPFHGALLDPADPAPDFTLTDQHGQPFRIGEQRGSLVLMFFGYTTCPDFCPTTMHDLAEVRRELGNDAERVRVVMVTVDPERDTAEQLQRYLATFDDSFTGLRGTQAELDPVLKAYGVTAIRREMPDSAMKYAMDHSTSVYAIDQSGKWRALFSYGMPIKEIASDVRYLLKTGG